MAARRGFQVREKEVDSETGRKSEKGDERAYDSQGGRKQGSKEVIEAVVSP